MLQELLFVIRGYPGEIFRLKDHERESEISLIVSSGLSSRLHPGEEKILNQICTAATPFYVIKERLRKLMEKHCGYPGAAPYIQALQCGVQKALAPYEAVALELEKEILKTGSVSLLRVLSEVEKYKPLIHMIDGILQEVQRSNTKDCSVLGVVWKYRFRNSNVSLDPYFVLLRSLSSYFLEQCAYWMLTGCLVAGKEDFFIEENRKGHFEIVAARLPSVLPISVAEDVLWLGQSLLQFKQHTDLSVAEVFDGRLHELLAEIVGLASLEDAAFTSFAVKVQALKKVVAQKLYRSLLTQGNFQSCLQELRSFHLLLKGEFFTAFVENAEEFLLKPADDAMQYRLTRALVSASYDSGMDPKEMSCITLKLDLCIDLGSVSCLDAMRLDYPVQWPTSTLITSSVLQEYQEMFRYLLRFSYAAFLLSKTWKACIRRRETEDDSVHPVLWSLWSSLNNIVRNLQMYIQLDIIEEAFHNLLNAVKGTEDFLEIKLAHEMYMKTLLTQSLLQLQPVSPHVMRVLRLTLEFCAIANTPATPLRDTQLSDLEEDLYSIVACLFLAVKSANVSNRDLEKFHLRLDYNDYWLERLKSIQR